MLTKDERDKIHDEFKRYSIIKLDDVGSLCDDLDEKDEENKEQGDELVAKSERIAGLESRFMASQACNEKQRVRIEALEKHNVELASAVKEWYSQLQAAQKRIAALEAEVQSWEKFKDDGYEATF